MEQGGPNSLNDVHIIEQNPIDKRETKDIDFDPYSGCTILLLLLLFLIVVSLLMGFLLPEELAGLWALLSIPVLLILPSISIVSPNQAGVVSFCGKYQGTIRKNGFFCVNPFFAVKKVSMKLNNFNTEPMKVNDKSGNPIMIGAIVSWRIIAPAKSVYDVEDIKQFIDIQTEAALRRVAYTYNYDSREGDTHCLKDGQIEVNNFLKNQISTHLEVAGVEIHNAEISNLSYAQEIASSMLRKQQAEAIVAARRTIIEGAVSMCGMAINSLKSQSICDVNDSERVKLVSNLLVVLCSESQVNPVVNTGSSY